jgi:chemotaxis protein MotB
MKDEGWPSFSPSSFILHLSSFIPQLSMADIADDDPPGVPEWVVTYGDMMSLLLTFFIMLVSMSALKKDEGKMRSMMNAIRQSFGPTKYTSGSPGPTFQTNSSWAKRSSRSAAMKGGLERSSRDSKGIGGAHKASRRISEGTLITLGGPAAFPPFQAGLSPELKRSLDVIARVVRDTSNQIVVRGHASPEPLPTNADFAAAAVGIAVPWPKTQPRRFLTIDNLPIHSQMDLSFARARSVADYLIVRKIDPHRLLVTAAGDTEQRQPTRNLGGQTMNRRVDVFLIDSYIAHPRSLR